MTARTINILFILLAVAVAGSLLLPVGCGGQEPAPGKFHCPMHPSYISDRPGDCPICGMKLVPIEEAPASQQGRPPAAASAPPPTHGERQAGVVRPGERKILFYRSPMDPEITSPVPAKDGMGMDFIPVYDDEAQASAGGIDGYAPVEVSADALELAGVQTAPAVEDTLGRTVRTVGIVMPAEPEVRHIHTKISGWVEKLHVTANGQFVRRGEPVLSIYSQELLASQEEYVQALAAAERFGKSSLEEVRRGGEDLARSARRRLELLDVPAEVLDELERTRTPRRTVPLLAPISGFVMAKETFEGQQIDATKDLFVIVDLSRVWVEADFYQYEAPEVRLGAQARVTSPYDASLSLSGRVSQVYPTLNAESRTLRVRFELPNPRLDLKPEMFVNIEMDLGSARGIVIPDSAIIDTGTRSLVFVDLGGGRFEPREIKVSTRSEGRAMATAGLAAGERVVTKAAFLLDSESRLRAAIAGAARGGLGGAP